MTGTATDENELTLRSPPKMMTAAINVETTANTATETGISEPKTEIDPFRPNDAEMLRAVGMPVAMGNADAALKNLAKYITADCDHDGVAQAVYHLFQ